MAQVPRAVWPSKPVGFGAALTAFLEPSETVHNLNLAALSSGEWYFDFGWPGLFLMVLVLGWLVRWLDLLFAIVHWFARSAAGGRILFGSCSSSWWPG